MIERYSLIGIMVSIIILFMDFYLLRKRKIQGRAFVLWFLIGGVLGLFSGAPILLEAFYILFGTQDALASILAAGFLFFLLAIFYLQYKISELHSLLMKLAMESSVAKHLREQNERKTKQIK